MSKSKLGCAFNYVGSKIRHAEAIEKVLPKEVNLKILEPFCGGFSLIHLYPESWEITANDKQSQLIDLHQCFNNGIKSELFTPESLTVFMKDHCHFWMNKHNKSDKESYEILKDSYNKEPRSTLFYALICSSFSNQIRFNKDGEFNLPKGDRYFNPNMEKKLLQYLTKLERANVTFENKDFREFDFEGYDLLVVDSPYANNGKSTASYNESGGWQLKDLVALLSKLDDANEEGVRWVAFNEVITKGEDNIIIQEWANKYNGTILKDTMTNCNYQRTGKRTVEVMVRNY